MKKLLYTLLIVVSLFTLVGCDLTFDFLPDNNDTHTHEYPSTWEFDETYHYKRCIDSTCTSTLKELHTFSEDGVCEKCGYDKNVVQYSVTFKDQDGTIIKTQMVEKGKDATAPTMVSTETLKFIKWDKSYTDVQEDLIITAIYENLTPGVIEYTVVFKDNNGNVLQTVKVEKGKAAIAPTVNDTDTLKFTGWDKEFSNVQSDLEVIAVFEEIIPDKDEYSITFDLNGGKWDYSSKAEFTYAFLCDFYDFVSPDETLESFIYDTDKAYKGNWKYYVGGSVGEVNKLLIDNNIDAFDEGYFFNCAKYKEKWYCLSTYVKNEICKSNQRFGNKSYEYGVLDFYRYVSNDPGIYIDYYGKEAIFYSYPKANITVIESYKYGEITELPVPNSVLFDYWANSKGEKLEKITATTKGDLTLKAIWKDKEEYVISFDADGGNNIDSINVEFAQSFDLPTPTKDGFKFGGWYYNDQPFKLTVYPYHKNITLKAKWNDINEVTLENLVYDGSNVTYRNTTTVVQIPTEYIQSERQLRACWVSSFAGDFSASTNQATMKKNLTEVLDIMEAFNMNCIIFHIRTHNQAFYKTKMTYIASEYGTYSSFEQWDYLKWFIDECHKRNIEFHAWLNPYRLVSSGATSLEDTAAKWKDYPDNPASKASNLLMNSDGNVIMNPGIQEVRDFIVDICMEIAQNYDIDAIHFDDYFYIKNIDDASTMKANNPKGLSVDNWRRSQVDLFIEDLSKNLREYNIMFNKHVQLGISPSGIYRNGDGTLEKGSNSSGYAHYGSPLYSDTYYWIKQGWIDYIMPQIYWGFTLKNAQFASVADWWNMAVEGTGCNFYAGMGLYMSLSSGNASWGSQPYEASNQILYTTKLKNCQGISFYKWASLKTIYQNSSKTAYPGVMRIKNEYWTEYVPTPTNMSTNYDYKNVTKQN